MIWDTLLGGLFGSIIGAVAGYFGTIHAATKQINAQLKQTQEQRNHDRREQLQSAKNALLVEARENSQSILIYNQNHTKFKFSTDAWDIYKSVVPEMSESLQTNLLKTYTEINRHNMVIEYDIRSTHGLGLYDDEIGRRVQTVKAALDALLAEFN